MDNIRTVEILRAGIWHNSDFNDIEKGDLFRMFEPPDNSPVIGTEGSYIFKAVGDVYKRDKDGVLTVNTIEIDTSIADEELGIYEEVR